MKNNLWHLPWTAEDVPHAVIDIGRGCNIMCRSCWNANTRQMKPLQLIIEEFETILKLRRIGLISILGGEVLLHPDLYNIIYVIRKNKVRVEIFTNGLLLTPSVMDKLKEAGTDTIFLHIQQEQTRPDLPDQHSLKDVWKLIDEKASLISSRGIDVGLTITVHGDRIDEMIAMIHKALESKHINYFLFTLLRDMRIFKTIEGDLLNGLMGSVNKEITEERKDVLTNNIMKELLASHFSFTPFAYVGSNVDRNDIRWLSYVIGTITNPDQQCISTSLKASYFERFFLRLHRFITGSYPFYRKQNVRQFQIQLLFNAFTGGNLVGNMKFLWQSFRRKGTMKIMRLLSQNLADIDSQGRIIHCLNCPDAVIKNGRLVPHCIIDKINT